MKFVGNVMRNGRPLVRGAAVHIRMHGKRWTGQIELPKDSNIFAGGYELILNDRRRGKITITSIEEGVAFFDGDGDLTH